MTTKGKRYASGLTTRQEDVLFLISDGHTQETIARILGISQNTVNHHVWALRQHFETKTMRQLIPHAREYFGSKALVAFQTSAGLEKKV